MSQQYRIGLGIQQLELGQELASQQLRVQRQQTAYEVKQAYYRVLQTQSARHAAEESLTFLRELDQKDVGRNKRSVSGGNEPAGNGLIPAYD